MALPTSYMTGGYTKIPQYFDTLLTARAPEKFTNKFMADLGFTSSTDRLFANVLKSIGFLDDSGVPTERYFKFLDQSCSKQMVAEGVREAYEDLFNLNVTAYTMSQAEVEGKFKTLTNGSKAAATITQMAKTFVALCGYADWSAATFSPQPETSVAQPKQEEPTSLLVASSQEAIKEFCKQCIEHSSLNNVQKELLKAAVDAARNINELFATGIAGLLGNYR